MLQRQLKNITFKWDEEKRELAITTWEDTGESAPPFLPNTIKINKLYMYSLLRFCIRVAQKPNKRKGGKHDR